MKRWKTPLIVFGLLLALVGLLAGLVGVTTAAAARDGGKAAPIRALLVFDDEVANSVAEDILAEVGGHQVMPVAIPGGWVVILPDMAAMRILGEKPSVLRVEKDAVVYALPGPPPGKGPKPKPTPTPAPTGEVVPWGVDRIDADLAWATSTGAGVKVAIIDTGVSYNHPDLAANYKGGYDFGDNDADPMDNDGHGTHVAGIVAAVDQDLLIEEEIGVIGVAPQADLYGVKVFDATGTCYVSYLINGIAWAMGENVDLDGDGRGDVQGVRADVINMSLGTTWDVQSLHDKVDAAQAAGIVVVAAAGNEGNPPGKGDNVVYPARYPSVIAVAATNSEDERPKWSSTGDAVELAAPGVDVYSTWKGDTYKELSGTSMASPHLAGTAALAIASHPTLSNEEIRGLLQSTADDLGAAGPDTKYGYGLVDAEEATTSP